MQAFISAETLPDFLYLLFKQVDVLHGKQAENIATQLDNILHRELSVERFQETMSWSDYDPRIRQRWDEFAAKMKWEPKQRTAGKRTGARKSAENCETASIIAQCALLNNAEIESMQTRDIHDRMRAVGFAIEEVRRILTNPVMQAQADWAMNAYGRLLSELGNAGEKLKPNVRVPHWTTSDPADSRTRSWDP